MKVIKGFGNLPRVLFILISSVFITVFIYSNNLFRNAGRLSAELKITEGKDSIKKTGTSKKIEISKQTKTDTSKIKSTPKPSGNKKTVKYDTVSKPPIIRNLLE